MIHQQLVLDFLVGLPDSMGSESLVETFLLQGETIGVFKVEIYGRYGVCILISHLWLKSADFEILLGFGRAKRAQVSQFGPRCSPGGLKSSLFCTIDSTLTFVTNWSKIMCFPECIQDYIHHLLYPDMKRVN